MTKLIPAFTLLFGLSALVPHLSAQTPAAQVNPIQIEVASIRPHKSTGDDPSNRQAIGGRFTATATTIGTLIRTGFAIDPNLILNAPEWVNSEPFDIQATITNHAEIRTQEQYQQLMLSLLEQYVGLKYHREPREAPVYWLILNKPNKLGPALHQTMGGQINISMNGNDRRMDMHVKNATMYDFAKAIQKQAGHTVEDHTGLTGHYDFQIQWAQNPSPELDDLPLPTVLKEQLGLKLQPTKGQVEAVVIDAITHPSTD